jgi:hypothetical protein
VKVKVKVTNLPTSGVTLDDEGGSLSGLVLLVSLEPHGTSHQQVANTNLHNSKCTLWILGQRKRRDIIFFCNSFEQSNPDYAKLYSETSQISEKWKMSTSTTGVRSYWTWVHVTPWFEEYVPGTSVSLRMERHDNLWIIIYKFIFMNYHFMLAHYEKN